MNSLRVGVATVEHSPKAGLPLMGNFRDDYAARGVHDPLCAKAFVVEDIQGVKAALLAVDICMLDRRNVAFVRSEIGAHSDVPPESVLIHATHTHSAPAPNNRIGIEAEITPHLDEIKAFLSQAASAVAFAEQALSEAALHVGYSGEDRISFNRRLRRRDGATQMNWEALQPGFDPSEIAEAWGPIDPQVTCLTVQRESRPVATMVNFGLHPAILAGDNWLYSADYPGYLAEALSRTVGPEFTCLFLNGCCGNVNHIDYRDLTQGRGYQMAQRVGFMLAAAAHSAIRTSSPTRAGQVKVSRQEVALERLKISSEHRQWCEQVLKEAAARPPQGLVDGVPDAYYARLGLEMWEQQDRPDEAEVMVVRIGDVAIVGLPGEAFCQLGLEIKRRSPAKHTIVAGLCNDAIGYLPTRESFVGVDSRSDREVREMHSHFSLQYIHRRPAQLHVKRVACCRTDRRCLGRRRSDDQMFATLIGMNTAPLDRAATSLRVLTA